MKKKQVSTSNVGFTLIKAAPAKGYFHARRQQQINLDVLIDENGKDNPLMYQIYSLLKPHLPIDKFSKLVPDSLHANHGIASLQILSLIAAALQQAAGDLVMEHASVSVNGTSEDGKKIVRMTLPTLLPRLGIETVRWILNFKDKCQKSMPDSSDKHIIASEVESAIKSLNSYSLKGYNPINFVRWAYEHQIPYLLLPGHLIQYGYGKGSRRFMSSFSDETSLIGSNIARNKMTSNNLLKMAGLPVAEQVHVLDLAMAKLKAAEMGYPVVIKPASLDNGRGVYPGIFSEKDLGHCFDLVLEHSKSVILEKHIPGDSFRVEVTKGNIIAIRQRIYPVVTGDGKKTIEMLVAELNDSDQRSDSDFSALKTIAVNSELIYFLQLTGRSLSTVPANGETVRLTRTSNWSQGGSSVPFTEDIHPDNVELCIEAAEVIGLDIAGIDLITDDITKSWKETEAVICEVNAQPQLVEVILDHYCTERAPVVITVDNDSSKTSSSEGFMAQAIKRSTELVSGRITVSDLRENGFPLAYIDALVLSENITRHPDLMGVLDIAVAHGVPDILASNTHPLRNMRLSPSV